MLLLLSPVAVHSQTMKSLTVISSLARAPGEIVKPITLDVKVKNTGSKPASGHVVVTLTPDNPPDKASTGSPYEPGLCDPYELTKTITDLPPGQVTTVHFNTPYNAVAQFERTSGFFSATNPTSQNMKGDIVVRYNIKIRDI